MQEQFNIPELQESEVAQEAQERTLSLQKITDEFKGSLPLRVLGLSALSIGVLVLGLANIDATIVHQSDPAQLLQLIGAGFASSSTGLLAWAYGASKQ